MEAAAATATPRDLDPVAAATGHDLTSCGITAVRSPSPSCLFTQRSVLLVSEGPGLSRKLREAISFNLPKFRLKTDSVEPKNEEKQVLTNFEFNDY